jgi:hypothetical protein
VVEAAAAAGLVALLGPLHRHRHRPGHGRSGRAGRESRAAPASGHPH